ncbi:MAG TPA: TonB-dependent receptor [Terriglobia bacterium]|nr:TonB-dependent receptor [Terriglobia bacterium]
MHRNSIAATIACVLMWAGTALAQNVGAISGRVTDTTGAVIPGATVRLQNLDTGFSRSVTTNAQGDYRAPELPLGQYQVEVTFPGFQTQMRSGINLTIGRDATVNFQLSVGEVQEIVTVTGDAPLVDTTKSEMGALVSREQISDLPLSNRDFSDLITLQAGTVQYRHATGAGAAVMGYGARISVSGARPTQNSFTLDGADINTATQLIPSGVDGAMLGVEAIREFKVLGSNYSAQYGRAAGANLMAVSRSGTNELHGSAFEYFRNDNLDAAEWDDNAFGIKKPELRRNQFGGSLGGPVTRDKLFFFTTYEGVRDRLPRTRTATVPTPEARTGVLRNTNCTVSNITVREEVKPYLALWPQPTGTLPACGFTADFVSTDNRPYDANYWSARMDYQFHSNHSLFGRYTLDFSNLTDIDTLGMFGSTSKARSQYVTLEERSILSPAMINAVRLAYTRSNNTDDVLEVSPPPASLSFLAGRPFGGIGVGSGITGLTGYSGSLPRVYILNNYQVYDDLTWELSNHSLKLGVAIERFIFHRTGVSRTGGAWTFTNFQNFLQNRPNRLRIQGPDRYSCPDYGTCYSDPHRSVTQTLFASYVQDDFRVRPNLTLNLGLRYEFTTVPQEKYGRLANIENLYSPVATVGGDLYPNPTLNNFSPRFGFAWDPTGTGKTSIRGGMGLFFDAVLALQWMVPIDRQPPFWTDIDVRANVLGSGTTSLFPNLNPVIASLALGPQAIHAIDKIQYSPYTLQYSLAVQRMLTSSTVAELGYTWTRGIHLGSRADMAVPQPIRQPDGRWFFPDPTNQNAPLLNPKFSRLEWYSSAAFSEYHGMRASFQHTMSQGLRLQVNYTWSKAMDNLSAQLSNLLGNSAVQNGFDPVADYSLADFHILHNFVSNFTYDLPIGQGKPIGSNWGGVANAILGGWQISGVFAAQTGNPFSIAGEDSYSHVRFAGGARPDLAPGGNNNPTFDDRVQWTRANEPGLLWFDGSNFKNQGLGPDGTIPSGYYGNLGRNTVIGPGMVKMDFSVLKNFPLGEEKNLQFRAEFFNLFNTPQFAEPDTSITSETFGRISSTIQNSGRQIQLALKFTF